MNNERFPRLPFLGETTDETTSHLTRLRTTAAKSLVIPVAQWESIARGIWIGGAKR